MSFREVGENLGECRKIEVIAGPSGWLVTEEGLFRGSYDNIENAYQNALEICTELFDAGIPARVSQVSAT